MCNSECLKFIEKCLDKEKVENKEIIEVGSRNVNGSPRFYIKSLHPKKYIGCDIISGKDVDQICDVNDLLLINKENSFDILISCEMIEHVKDWQNAINNMKGVLRDNGYILITTRSPGFPYHGYPKDYWRFTKEDIKKIFRDFEIIFLESDSSQPGVFLFAKKKPMINSSYSNLQNIELSSPISILAHTSFIGHTGFANHSREFFTTLNQLLPVRVRNFSHYPDISYLSEEQKNMIIEQKWSEAPWKVGKPYKKDLNSKTINIILNETNHYYFYHKYEGLKIAYNVWESTRQPEKFFKKLLEYDELWVPTYWQRKCSIEQGYPEDKVKIVPEGVDGNIFKPLDDKEINNQYNTTFKFLLFGRWDYRKSTTEIIKAFIEEFDKDERVELICSIDNKFPVDGMNSTEERLKYYDLNDYRIKIEHFPPFRDYLYYLQHGHVLVSCSRSEGWNLPLIEAIACGIPTICSDYGAQLEFADGISHKVLIKDMQPPQKIFMQGDDVPGLWAEPDFDHLKKTMRYVYEEYSECKRQAVRKSENIRKQFSWENAANIALKHIVDLSSKDTVLVKNEIKLNIGCGKHIRDGYINIDKYHEKADLKLDAKDLKQFKDNSVNEITSSHMLEHVSKHEVFDVLKEWYRVLKYDGKLSINVPNFEWCIKHFLELSEEDKWTDGLNFIFGHQEWEGEQHRIGFTRNMITKLLKESGFYDITIKDLWSHNQNCLYINAYKKEKEEYKVDNEVFIIGCYADNQEKRKLLKDTIKKVKDKGFPIIITTHYPLPEDIQKEVDFILFEKENILSDDWSLNYWYEAKNYLKIVGKFEHGNYQSAAILSMIKNALNFCSDRYIFGHYIESDTIIDLDKYLDKVKKERNKFVGFEYLIDSGITTNIMSFDIKWFNSKLKRVSSWKEYQEIGQEIAKKSNRNEEFVFEHWLHRYFTVYDMFKYSTIFSNEIANDIIINRNIINKSDKEPKIRALLSDIKDSNETLLFIINNSENSINYKVIDKYNNNETDDMKIEKSMVHWYKFKKRKDIYNIEVYINNEIFKTLELDPNKIYDETTFKFYDNSIECVKWVWGNYGKQDYTNNHFSLFFIDGPKLSVKGDDNKIYDVEFIDNDNEEIIYKDQVSPGKYLRPFRKYFTNWKVVSKLDDKIIFSHIFDASDKRVLITLDSKSLGDTIAWFPYTEEFRKKHNCKVIVSTFWNDLFRENYKEIDFVEPGTVVHNLYASYTIGCFDNDYNKNKNNWRTIPLQKIASDTLGLDYTEIKPKIVINNDDEGFKVVPEKYVCISEHSTLQCKYWNRKNGWQKVVDFINKIGYKVLSISKESTNLNGVEKYHNRPIQETIYRLKNCNLFIGVSSGLAWLAWALNIPVIMISGCSLEMLEFQTGIKRIINKNVCHGCLNDPNLVFDRGNWNWCPRDNNFICSKEITETSVLKAITEVFKK